MKIAWLHDHTLEDSPGGAQLTNAAMIAAAPDWADIIPCYSGRLPSGMPQADAYILNNVKDFSQAELKVAVSKPHIVYEHDYWDLHQGWQRDWIMPVMNGAWAVIFLSPLHREAFLRQHPGVRPKKTYLVPSPIDPEEFTVQADEPRQGTCWLGEFQPHKGIKAACQWASEHETVDFYGWGPVTPSGKNVHIKGLLRYEEIPRALARYERFLFLPEWVEPFGRTVAEAKLAGCELILNERVGALSWGWETREEWAKGVGTAASRFWEVLGGVLL